MPANHPPRASIIVPARNEQYNITPCVKSLLAQGDGFEILVADDSSTDQTAAIIEQLAAEHSGLRLIRVPPLPAGWLGKNHALHVAVQSARGEWLLFTDADTRHVAGTLGMMIARAEREGIDMLSLSPEQVTETWWEKTVIPIIYDLLAELYDFDQINDASHPKAAANGQYILIHRSAYDAMGGHAAIRAQVLEDVELAGRVKRAGRRIWFGSGKGVVGTRMYRRFGDMWDGWTKNLFLLFARDAAAMRRAALRLFTRPRFHRYYPAGAVMVFLLLANSYWRYSRNLGVKWKGRHYANERGDHRDIDTLSSGAGE